MKDNNLGCDGPDRSPKLLAMLRQALIARQRPLHQLAEYHALLGGETRLKILALLNRANELCVCDLAKILEMTPAAISQHLSRLRSGRLVESRRDGMTIFYRVSELAVESGALPVLEMPIPEED